MKKGKERCGEGEERSRGKQREGGRERDWQTLKT